MIPDISIYNDKDTFLLEVKVDQKLNVYKYKKEKVDQIKLYKKIDNIKDVYIIEKRYNDTKELEPDHHINWTKIAEIAKESLDKDRDEYFLLNCFIELLKENNMSIEKVNEISIGVSALSNLMKIFDSVLSTNNISF